MDAADLHSRTSAIFQSFCKFEQASVRENTGVGDVAALGSEADTEVQEEQRLWDAIAASGAEKFVEDFPNGLDTILEADGMGGARHNYHLQHYNHPPPPYASAALQPNGLHSIFGSPERSKACTDIGKARLSGGQVRGPVFPNQGHAVMNLK